MSEIRLRVVVAVLEVEAGGCLRGVWLHKLSVSANGFGPEPIHRSVAMTVGKLACVRCTTLAFSCALIAFVEGEAWPRSCSQGD